ncbi:MAG: RidA family protein [Bacteroidetes bacterium]|nr:RidA family protein [Bacteroidota bacterium]
MIKAVLICSLISGSLFAQKKFINPEGLIKPAGYTHVIIADNTVYISGQVSANEKGEVIGKGDIRAQAEKVFSNLETCLRSVGLTFSDVVKINTFIVNLKPEDLAVVREVRKKYLPQENPPASTLVGVTALANPDFLLEIEAVAVKK